MIVDYRCGLSGLSLLGAETMAVLHTPMGPGQSMPCSLPLWGTYDGSGTLVEVQEGPNAELLVRVFSEDLDAGRAQVDWRRLTIAPVPIDHIETLLALIRTNEIHGLGAVTWRGHEPHVALFESNIAAAAMQGEPDLLHGVRIDDLLVAVLGESALAQAIYARIGEDGPKMRCKWGLSLVALAALISELIARGLTFRSPVPVAEQDRDPAQWLALSYADLREAPLMLEALSEYSSQLLGAESDESMGEHEEPSSD